MVLSPQKQAPAHLHICAIEACASGNLKQCMQPCCWSVGRPTQSLPILPHSITHQPSDSQHVFKNGKNVEASKKQHTCCTIATCSGFLQKQVASCVLAVDWSTAPTTAPHRQVELSMQRIIGAQTAEEIVCRWVRGSLGVFNTELMAHNEELSF